MFVNANGRRISRPITDKNVEILTFVCGSSDVAYLAQRECGLTVFGKQDSELIYTGLVALRVRENRVSELRQGVYPEIEIDASEFANRLGLKKHTASWHEAFLSFWLGKKIDLAHIVLTWHYETGIRLVYGYKLVEEVA